MANPTFTRCRCPHCKLPLDFLEITETQCPRCHQTLEPQAVWLTRTYEGQIDLPPWILAFTWPLALMILGAFVAWYASLFMGGIALSVGLVFFFAKLALNTRDI